MPAAERLKQLRANLERWRWITEELGDRFVMVNVAGFRVGVFEAGQAVLFMPAIVGRAYRQTPDFSGKISTITLNPAWNVPPKLAREDILPKLKKDPSYLKKKGFRVFESWSDGAREIDGAAVDWTQIKANSLSFKFRQDPGPQNALGRILFLFPNKFDVYMHDTPERLALQPGGPRFQLGLHPDREAPRPRPLRPARRSVLDEGEDPGDHRFGRDEGHSSSEAAPGPHPLLDGVARCRRAGPIPAGHLSAGRGPRQGLGRTRRGNGPLGRYQVRTRPTSTWTKSDPG